MCCVISDGVVVSVCHLEDLLCCVYWDDWCGVVFYRVLWLFGEYAFHFVLHLGLQRPEVKQSTTITTHSSGNFQTLTQPLPLPIILPHHSTLNLNLSLYLNLFPLLSPITKSPTRTTTYTIFIKKYFTFIATFLTSTLIEIIYPYY